MNREIKFRARPCYNGGKQPQWVYGTFQYIGQHRIKQGSTDNGMLEPRVDKGRIVDLYGNQTEVLCDTVGQFTGLYDKNGKEIYEGDIVRKRDRTFWLKYEGVVVYNSEIGAFRIHSEKNGMTMRIGFELSDVFNDGQCTIPIKYDYEVIGNVHDNPELLK